MKRLLLVFLLVVVSGCAQPGAPVASPTGASQASATAKPPVSPAATVPATPIGAVGAPSTSVAQRTKVTLAMGYIPSVQFAPFYVAQERGYFAAEGLDVSFNYGTESDLLKLVGTNQLQFLIGSGDQVILGRSQGLPVRYVMRWYRHFPVVLFAKADSGIKAPQDLAGKRVGISMLSGASYVAWQALVYAAKVDPGKVNLQTIGFTQAAAVSQGRVDAALDYTVNGPVQLRLAGQPVNVIAVSDYIDLPSNGIITNDQTIQGQPQVIQKLVSATLRGLADTLSDPSAAFDISLKAVPEAGGAQKATNRAIFDESLKLWQVDGASLGLSDPAAWQAAATFMRQTGLIQSDVKAEDLYTNQFVAK